VRTKRTLKRSPKQNKPKTRKAAGPVIAESPSCYCYMVECSDGTLYTGWTTNTERRVKVHNAGRGARYTSMRRPVKLVYVEPQPDRTSAMKRERAIKALPRRKKQALILSMLAQPH
jgi:putative endonuclease